MGSEKRMMKERKIMMHPHDELIAAFEVLKPHLFAKFVKLYVSSTPGISLNRNRFSKYGYLRRMSRS